MKVTLNSIIKELENEYKSFDEIAIDEMLSRLKLLKARMEWMMGCNGYMYEASSKYEDSAEKSIREILGQEKDSKNDYNPSRRENNESE